MPIRLSSGGGGGGGGSIQVTDGTTTVNPTTTLDFTDGVTVTDAGGGQANAAGGLWTRLVTQSVTTTTGLTAGAYGKLSVCTGTTANYNVTLPDPTGNSGKVLGLAMSPLLTRFVTILPHAAETIDGASSRLMWSLETAILYTDGTNWFKVAGRTLGMICRIALSASMGAGAWTSGVVTLVTCDTSVIDNTGRMANLGSNAMTIQRTGLYEVSSQIVGTQSNPAGGTIQAICQKNGATNVQNGIAMWDSGQVAIDEIITPLSLVATDSLTLQGFQDTGNSQRIFGSAGFNTTLIAFEVPAW